MARTKDYTAQNQKLFEAGLKKYADKTIKPMLEAMLKRIADWMVDIIDGKFEPFSYEGGGTDKFPVWYGNLHDFTGIGVYVDGKLSYYSRPAMRSMGSDEATFEELGVEDPLESALRVSLTDFANGMWIVLFSAVPYAYKLNVKGSKWGRGIGFFDELEDYLREDVFWNLQEITS